MREALTQDHLPYIGKLNPGCSSRISATVSTFTYGHRSFYKSSAELWNNLPMHVKSCRTVSLFKSSLKTHWWLHKFNCWLITVVHSCYLGLMLVYIVIVCIVFLALTDFGGGALGTYHFLPNGGAMKKLGSHRIFFTRNRGVTKKIIGWLQILMKILFNEIAPKCIFSALRTLGVIYFFNIVAPGGGVIKFLIIK